MLQKRDMKHIALLTFTLALAPLLPAADLGTLIFSDDFNRSESQEKTDEPGNGWGTNSKSRAKGDKQVDLADGAMRIFISPQAVNCFQQQEELAYLNVWLDANLDVAAAYLGESAVHEDEA